MSKVSLTPETKGRLEMAHHAAIKAQTAAPAESFTPPTFEEMAAYMDAEMVRMGMAQQADGTWRCAA
ncbi:hypothetical protein D9M68_757000 [compost metagenome]